MLLKLTHLAAGWLVSVLACLFHFHSTLVSKTEHTCEMFASARNQLQHKQRIF